MISYIINQLNKHILISAMALSIGLTSCSGGSDPASTPPPPPVPINPDPASLSITGGGVKGPLTNAVVTVYAFDASQVGFRGTVVGSGITDASAAITGLGLPFPLNPPYIMEFTSTPGTTIDITTAMFPVITTMRTVITQALLDAGEQIYATPLTTMAVDIAVANAGTGATSAQFETALTAAAAQVVSTLGFGMDSSVNIFDTPPLINATTAGAAEQAAVAAYRTAVEAVTAIAYQISQQSTGATTDTVLADLAATIADNGIIDDSAGTTLDTNTLQVLEQDPAFLTIPNTSQTVADVQTTLAAETTTTGSTTTTTDLTDGTVTTVTAPAETNPDIDSDGVLNVDDAFPENGAESVDTDGDGIGDVADPDDDNNGILDEDEGAAPVVTVTDTDGDGFDDGVDNCPTNYNPAQTNTDTLADGGDACDIDDDEDGVLDTADAFPLDATESIDTDNDGLGNVVADSDDDNDGVADGLDAGFAPAGAPSAGIACSLLTDCDGDGVLDAADFNPVDAAVTFNFAPVANSDAVTVNEDAALFSIPVTTNDTDDDGNPADSVTLSTVESNNTALGTVAKNGNNIDYTPVADASGVDTFAYTVTDGTVTSQGSVTVTIIAVNDDPVITQTGPLVVVMDEDSVPTAFIAPAIDAADVESDTLTWTLSSAATSGTATVSGTGPSPTVTYAPNANANGPDSFDVTVSDGNGGSDVITVDVIVTAQNDLPVITQTGPLAIVMDEDSSPIAFVAPAISALDLETPTISLIWSGTVASDGTAIVSGTGVSPVITYVPDADFNGTDTFNVIVSDGVATSFITVNVTVNSLNDVPVVGAAGPFSIAEDVVNGTLVGTVTATDVDSSVQGYNITGGNTGDAFAIDSSGQITVADATVIDFESGITSYNLIIRATDGIMPSATEVVVVNITDVNDTSPVVGVAGPFTVSEAAINTAVVGSVIATDADSLVTDYSITSGDAGSAFDISTAGVITVANTTAIDYETATSFNLTITATDGVTSSAGVVVVVNVTDANDSTPVVVAGQSFNVINTATNGTVVGSVSASDADTDTGITNFSITGSVFAISSSGQITVADNSTLLAGSPYTVTVDATDGMNTSAGESVTITVVSNTPPVIAQTGPLLVTMDEDGSPTAFVAPTITATDAEMDSLTWSTTGASSGLATVSGTGPSPTINYVPNGNFSGGDSFIVNVNDGTSTVGITVNVTVTPVNDAPVALDDSVDITAEDTPVTTVNVLMNDTDTENDALNVSAADISSSNGGVVVNNSNGTFDYTPALNFNGTDSFTYTVSDGFLTSLGTVFIDVTPVNDAPVAFNDTEIAIVDVALITGNVLTNDTDAENDGLSVTASDPASANGGTVSDNANGTFTYTSASGYTGPDSFDYTVSDGEFTDVGTVNITVSAAGTPISITTLMSGTEGGVAGIDDNQEPNTYEYWTDNWDSSTTLFSFEDKRYNHATGVFDSITSGNDLILVGSAWEVEGNIYGTAAGDAMNISIRSVNNDAAEVASIQLTARYVDLGGELISNYLDSAWQAAMIDPAAVFNTGAKLITEYRFEALSVSYWLWDGDWCEFSQPARFATLLGNCEAVDVDTSINATGYAQVIEEVIAANAWVDPNDSSTPPGALSVAWNGSTTLMVQLVTGGAANYYVVDWSSPDAASRVGDAVAGADWVRDNSPGVDMLQFQIPAAFVAQFPGDLDEGLNYFIVVQNSFVRRGQKDVVGDVGFESGVLNGIAMTDILANFDPILALGYNHFDVTTGTIYDVFYWSSQSEWCSDFYIFDVDGSFEQNDSTICGINPDSGSYGGVLLPGTYSIDPTTGVLTVTDGVDTDYGKVVGYNEALNARVVCWSASETGPWDCTDFSSQFVNSTAATSAMNTLNAGSLGCNYVSGWDNINGIPATFNSLTDFQSVVTACGGALPTIDADVIGTWNEDSTTEGAIFNADYSGSFTDLGTPFEGFTWSIVDNMIFISNAQILDIWARTPSGMKFYTEEIIWGSDLNPDGIADGEIWDSNYVKEGSLACGYESGFDDVLNDPLVFNSFTDFETVVADCGGATPTVDADVIGTWVDSYDDFGVAVVQTWVFNNDATADFTETRDAVVTDNGAANWSLSNNYVSVTVADDFLDVWGITPSGVMFYTELFDFSSNPDLLTLDGVREGEIRSSGYIKQ